jgi:hypothetical protein
MPQVVRKVWKCAFEDCGHEWYKYKTKEPPDRCAGCKRAGWNKENPKPKKESLPEKEPSPSWEALIPDSPVENPASKPVPKPAIIVVSAKLLSNCPVCSAPLKEWGTVKRCETCGRNF